MIKILPLVFILIIGIRFSGHAQSQEQRKPISLTFEEEQAIKEKTIFPYLDAIRHKSEGRASTGRYSGMLTELSVSKAQSTPIRVKKGEQLVVEAYAHYENTRNKKLLKNLAIAVAAGVAASEINKAAQHGEENKQASRTLAYGTSGAIAIPSLIKYLKGKPQAMIQWQRFNNNRQLLEQGETIVNKTAKSNWQLMKQFINVSEDGYVVVHMVNKSKTPVWFDDVQLAKASEPIPVSNEDKPKQVSGETKPTKQSYVYSTMARETENMTAGCGDASDSTNNEPPPVILPPVIVTAPPIGGGGGGVIEIGGGGNGGSGGGNTGGGGGGGGSDPNGGNGTLNPPGNDNGDGGGGGKPSEPDCAGVEGGSAHLDDCGVCVGGNTGKTTTKYFLDNDKDGWGNTALTRNCNATPPYLSWSLKGGDVDDNCYDVSNSSTQCQPSPCQDQTVNEITSFPSTNAALKTLRSSVLSGANYEIGYPVYEDALGYTVGNKQQGNANDPSVNLQFNEVIPSPGENVVEGFLHSHYQGTEYTFSADDVYNYFMKDAANNFSNLGSDIIGLVNPNGSAYILEVTNSNALYNYFYADWDNDPKTGDANGKSLPTLAEFTGYYYAGRIPGNFFYPNDPEKSAEFQLLSFMNNIGLSVYKATTFNSTNGYQNFTKLNLDSTGRSTSLCH